MMQAFIYHHLVPAEDWMVSVAGRGRLGAALQAWGKGRLRGASNFRAAGGFAAAPAARGDTPVKLPTGGTVQVQVPSPVGTLLDQVQLQLSEPPEGVAIEKVSSSPGAVAILLRADAAKAKPGLKGNLIVEASVERTFPRPDGKQPGVTRRVPLGALPAIPFEIVGR
jgi:hypothetical protein